MLIGRNGSGKSTLISLLLQLYQPTSGKITLCGTDISELVLKDYRNMVSVVSQDIYLFNSSIRDNICMYKDIDDKFIMEACKDSGLADFISGVSLDYVVGQNGAMLSEDRNRKLHWQGRWCITVRLLYLMKPHLIRMRIPNIRLTDCSIRN